MILCYHDVDDSWQSPLAVTPDRFREHCAWLAESGRVEHLGQVLGDLDEDFLSKDRRVALTFDDGLAGVYDHALESLTEQRLPFAVYIVAATLKPEGQPVDWVDGMEGAGLRTMTRTQIAELLSEGAEIGSHTWRHADLTTLTPDECLDDLRRSREFLEDMFGVPVPTLAYPRGRHNEHVRRAAAEAGYEFALALPEQPEPFGPHAVPRVGVYASNGRTGLAIKSSRAFWKARMSPVYPAMRSAVRVGYRMLGR